MYSLQFPSFDCCQRGISSVLHGAVRFGFFTLPRNRTEQFSGMSSVVVSSVVVARFNLVVAVVALCWSLDSAPVRPPLLLLLLG